MPTRASTCMHELSLSPDIGTFWLIRIMDCLNSSRSSARSMEGSFAPISSTPYLARSPFCAARGWVRVRE